jgi:hypothetical protein
MPAPDPERDTPGGTPYPNLPVSPVRAALRLRWAQRPADVERHQAAAQRARHGLNRPVTIRSSRLIASRLVVSDAVWCRRGTRSESNCLRGRERT